MKRRQGGWLKFFQVRVGGLINFKKNGEGGLPGTPPSQIWYCTRIAQGNVIPFLHDSGVSTQHEGHSILIRGVARTRRGEGVSGIPPPMGVGGSYQF